jgi:non-ribosomal peptide synthetase component E (peptide arylation enzyme)
MQTKLVAVHENTVFNVRFVGEMARFHQATTYFCTIQVAVL